MSDELALTDPAFEMAELCARLCVNNSKPGHAVLAELFEVKPHGREFQKLVGCIYERADLVFHAVSGLDLDPSIKNSALNHISTVRGVFTYHSLSQTWGETGYKQLSITQQEVLRAYSGHLRPIMSYAKITPEIAGEILAEVDITLAGLEALQTEKQEFFRQALLDGLREFRFRLVYLQWTGWGYCLDSLNQVVFAEMALQGAPGFDIDPNANEMFKLIGNCLGKVYKTASGAAGHWSNALKLYGLYSAGHDAVQKLLEHLPKH